jgi:hypothetical protein
MIILQLVPAVLDTQEITAPTIMCCRRTQNPSAGGDCLRILNTIKLRLGSGASSDYQRGVK